MNKKKHIIFFSAIILSLIFAGVAFAACSLQNISGCDRAGLITVIMDLIKSKQQENVKLLTKFNATEIITNKLPESVSFWTTAYCPSTGTNYDYQIPKEYKDYNVECSYGGIGSHKGCSTCIISKIKLSKKTGQEIEEPKITINTKNLTEEIFKSDEKLISFLKKQYIVGEYDEDAVEVQEVKRGKFDVLNKNDVAMIDIFYNIQGAIFIIEKGKNYYYYDVYEYTPYRIGSSISFTENYFVNDNKPFFEGYDGYATSGGCVVGSIDENLYRIYEGKLKKVFSYTQNFDGRKSEAINIYKAKSQNGFLTIIGHNNQYQAEGNNAGGTCGDTCSPCDNEKLLKTDIFKIYKWNKDNQEFDLTDKAYIDSVYSTILSFKDEEDIKAYFDAESIEGNNLPQSISYTSNSDCKDVVIPNGFQLTMCEDKKVILTKE